MNTLSTHVLDIALGRPAHGISVTLERDGRVVGSGVTDTDGRVRDLVSNAELPEGTYRLTFRVEGYFAKQERESFYDNVLIEFRIAPGSGHYHVPLLLSPFGYSTYRGS